MYPQHPTVHVYIHNPTSAGAAGRTRRPGMGWLYLSIFLAALYFMVIMPLMALLYTARPAETINAGDNVTAVVIATFLFLPAVSAFGMFRVRASQHNPRRR